MSDRNDTLARMDEAMARAMWMEDGHSGEGFALLLATKDHKPLLRGHASFFDYMNAAKAARVVALTFIEADGWKVVRGKSTIGMASAAIDAQNGEHIDGSPTGWADIIDNAIAASPPFGDI